MIDLDSLSEYIKKSCALQSANAKHKLSTKEWQAKIRENELEEERLLNELRAKEGDLRVMKKELITLEMMDEEAKREQTLLNTGKSLVFDFVCFEYL